MKVQQHLLPEDSEIARLAEYCERDVETTRELWRRLPTTGWTDRWVYDLNERVNDRGLLVDSELILAAIAMAEENRRRGTLELVEITGGAVPSGQCIEKMLRWLTAAGVDLDSISAAAVDKALATTGLPDDARRVLEIRQSLSRSSVAKFGALRDRTCLDGRVRDCHLYYGAATGRFAGQGVQPQNLPRGILPQAEVESAISLVKAGAYEAVESLWGDVAGVLASLIRPTIVGDPLAICDYAAIEARVLAWVAGETGLLETFRRGDDPYKTLAARIFGVPAEAVTKDQRCTGKVAVLGLGYGMGASTFAATCDRLGQPCDARFAEQVVGVYRGANPAICKFWRRCEDAAFAAVRGGKRSTVGPLTFDAEDHWLFLRLPSGRRIAYWQPQLEAKDGRDRLIVGDRQLYGGLIVENVVQAIARDVLVDAMGRLEGVGIPVVLHVHDEIVAETDRLDEMVAIMERTPSWANGLPLAVEGSTADRYRK